MTDTRYVVNCLCVSVCLCMSVYVCLPVCAAAAQELCVSDSR